MEQRQHQIEFRNLNILIRMAKKNWRGRILGHNKFMLQEIEFQQQSEENEHSMSTDEILPTILGEWTGYVCGKGLGKRPPKKSYVQQIDFEASMSIGMCQEMQAEMQRKLQEEREQMAAELLSKLEEQATSELQRKLEEEHSRMDIQVDKRTLVKVDAFMIRMPTARMKNSTIDNGDMKLLKELFEDISLKMCG